jgi:hypothetical protein
MLFAIFEASIVSQEHDADDVDRFASPKKGTKSTLQAICDWVPLIRLVF